jgi:hypothetical protein
MGILIRSNTMSRVQRPVSESSLFSKLKREVTNWVWSVKDKEV